MIFLLFLHVTDVFAMLLEPQASMNPQKEATFASYEGEPVFADPQHNQYGVKEFWWEQTTAEWQPWWNKENVTVKPWNPEESSTKKDVTEIWTKRLIDKTTRKKIDTSTTHTLPVSYTTGTFATPTADPIYFTDKSRGTFATPTADPIYFTDKSRGTFATPTADPIYFTDKSRGTFATPTADPIYFTDKSRGTFATPTADLIFFTDILKSSTSPPVGPIFLTNLTDTHSTLDGPIFLVAESSTSPPVGPIILTNITDTHSTLDGPIFLVADEEQRAEYQSPQSQTHTKHDFLLEILTASSLRFPQQNIADLIALREGPELESHPKVDDPFDRELYRQLGVDNTESLSEVDADFSRESPVFLTTPNNKAGKVDKKDIADIHEDKANRKKPTGLHGWRLQYAGRTASENRPIESAELPVTKDFIDKNPEESFLQKYDNYKPTPISFEKPFLRSVSPSNITESYKTSISDADYYDIINSGNFIPVVSLRSKREDESDINSEDEQWVKMFHSSNQNPHSVTSIAKLDYDEDKNMRAGQQLPTLSSVNPLNLLFEIQNNLKSENPTGETHKGLHANSIEVYDLEQPDLIGKPVSPGHVREGTIDDTTTNQSITSATNTGPNTQTNQDPETQTNADAGIQTNADRSTQTNAVPGIQTNAVPGIQTNAVPDIQTNTDPGIETVASATTQNLAISISQGSTVMNANPAIFPAIVAARLTFTVPNMETTAATTLPPTTTTETTKFTLEMAPRPWPNNLQGFDIDWNLFEQSITTTDLPNLLLGYTPEVTVLSTPHPMVVEMRTEMIEQRIGYFTVFMRKLLDIVSKKDEDELAALLKAGSESLDRLNEFNQLIGLGRPMWPGIQLMFYHMRLLPLDTLKNHATLGHMYYKSGALTDGDAKLQELDNQINAVYQVREGENLMSSLVPLEAFPGEQGEFNADKVMEDIFRAILAPWFRSKNSDTMYSLLFNLNERFEIIQKRYFGGARRKHLQNKDVTNRQNIRENKKPYADSKSDKTEGYISYDDISGETTNNIDDNRVIDEDENNKIRSTNDKIHFNTKHKTKTTNRYNIVHYCDTVSQKPTKKYQKSYRDNKKTTKVTKYLHYEPSKDVNKYISNLISKEVTRENRLFVKGLKNYNLDTSIKNRKIANVYEKDKLKKRINYDGGFKTDRFILQNKKRRSNSHDNNEMRRRNDEFTDKPTKQINDYNNKNSKKKLEIIEKRVNMMKTSQRSALSKEKHDEYDTYDDSAKADSREIKGREYGIKVRKINENIKIETKSNNYNLSDRTTKQTNDYDSYDEDKSKTIVSKVIKIGVSPNNELSKRNDDHYDTYDDSSGKKEIRHIKSKNDTKNNNIINAIDEVRVYNEKKGDNNALSSFEMELKNNYQEIQSFNKNLENVVNKKPEIRGDIRRIPTNFKNTQNHGNKKQKLSERVLQKRFEIKQNPHDSKTNSKNNKVWDSHVSSLVSDSETKSHGNKNVLVKDYYIPIDFKKNSQKPENKEKLWSYFKSHYILRRDDPYLKERFLDFNRDDIQTKKKDNLRNLNKNVNILRLESSYSDEEQMLKSNLQDNLLHEGRNFTDTLHKYKKNNPIRDISSYSDDEDILKKNIYKTFT